MQFTIIARLMRYSLTGFAFVPSIASACSLAPSYRVPTNLELAAVADVIVVATVSGEKVAPEPWDNSVIATPDVSIKGDKLPSNVKIEGAQLAQSGWPLTRSDPRELRKVNADALVGSCVRTVFAKGMKLVLFLEQTKDGQFTPIRSAFSRDSEDVPRRNALWVKAIREYAAIGKFPKNQWKTKLKSRIGVLKARINDPDATAIANDMAIELQQIQWIRKD